MSTEGIPSLWRGNSASLHPCLAHTPISICFTGFKLGFAYCYIILCLSLFISPLSSPFFSIPILFNSLIPLCHSIPPTYAPLPPGKAVLWVSHHTKGTNTKHTNQPQLTLGYSKEQESMVLVLAFWKRKTGTHQTKQRKIPQRKNIFCLFTFWCISHRFSAKWFLSFLKKKWKKITIYTRSLAQGVKFTDFFFNEKNTQKKATSGVFYLSTLLLCFP